MSEKEYADMSVEELEAKNREFMRQKDEIRFQQGQLTKVLDQKLIDANAQRKAAKTSDAPPDQVVG